MSIHTSKLDRCFWECTSTAAVRQCSCPCHKPRKARAIEASGNGASQKEET